MRRGFVRERKRIEPPALTRRFPRGDPDAENFREENHTRRNASTREQPFLTQRFPRGDPDAEKFEEEKEQDKPERSGLSMCFHPLSFFSFSISPRRGPLWGISASKGYCAPGYEIADSVVPISWRGACRRSRSAGAAHVPGSPGGAGSSGAGGKPSGHPKTRRFDPAGRTHHRSGGHPAPHRARRFRPRGERLQGKRSPPPTAAPA